VLLHSYKLFASTTGEMTGVSQLVLLSLIFRSVIQPSLMILMHHSQFLGSLHPQRIISPLRETSQPVLWKQTLHPTSQRTAMERRLLMGPGRQWAMRASGGSFCSSRSIACVVRMLVLPGCIMLMPRLVCVFGEAGALDISEHCCSVDECSEI
jgi:hypothetical protein